MRKRRIALAGGGSGGHIYGILAVAEALKIQAQKTGDELDLRYYGDAGQYALELASAGIKIRHITESKIRQYFSLVNVLDLIKFAWSIPQTLWKLFWFMPDVTFSKGGPGAFVVVLASWYYRIPVIIHDGDSIPGRTTRWTEALASKILLAFQSATEYLVHKERIMVIGNPIRANLAVQPKEQRIEEKRLARSMLGFSENRPLVLILGGSQGAATINNFVLENIGKFVVKYQLLHQTGVNNFQEVNAVANELTKNWGAEEKKSYRPVPFLQADMQHALRAADLVIARAGAGTIFELAAAQIPAILVPITESANDHQQENAFQYKEAGACMVVEEENLFGDIMIGAIEGILGNPEQKNAMIAAAARFAKPDASTIIAQEILAIKN